MANLLELANYSITFYIYCLFSEDFRNTLLRTMKWPWIGSKTMNHRKNDVSLTEHKTYNVYKMNKGGLI